MNTYKDDDGYYRTAADSSRKFDYEHQANQYERDLLYGSHQQPTDYSSGGSEGSGGGVSISWDDFKEISALCAPTLILYWVIAFPALNASWLLQHASAPFSWIGGALFNAWDLLVKAVGAPYYLAYLAGNIGVYFAMPIIAIVWCVVLSLIITRIRKKRPKLVKKAFLLLIFAAAVPVVLVGIAFVFGALRGDSIAFFWYGHDPYTAPLWEYFNRYSTRMFF